MGAFRGPKRKTTRKTSNGDSKREKRLLNEKRQDEMEIAVSDMSLVNDALIPERVFPVRIGVRSEQMGVSAAASVGAAYQEASGIASFRASIHHRLVH